MNYYKKNNRVKFIEYWNGEVAKKLFRCSKEFGFYKELKKTLNTSYSYKRDEFIVKTLDELLAELNRNKRELVNFSEILTKENNFQYPVCTALYSKLHLSHLFTLLVLQKCKISHQTVVEAFNWMTNELFNGKNGRALWAELKIYVKLFFS